jgi:hypothetical protein
VPELNAQGALKVTGIEMAAFSFACSWAMTLGNFGASNAHCVSLVTDVWHEMA